MGHSPLPTQLARAFRTSAAHELGVTEQRLRGADLERPFRGVRMRALPAEDLLDRYALALRGELALIRALAVRLDGGQFFSHRSAALLWEAPLPYRAVPELHIGVIAPRRPPRIDGVIAHGFRPARVELARLDGLALTTPAFTFASLGSLPLGDLVAVGDHLVRVHRSGYGRRDVGKPPFATIAELTGAVELGRWRGAPKLRKALELVREDSWSPRESTIRVLLVLSGLPEPELNVDVFDRNGRFLACPDMLYRRYKVAVEYQGGHHADRFAEDVERIEGLRADGWEVIQVTKVLAVRPAQLVARVEAALRERGLRPVETRPSRATPAARCQ